MPSHLTSFLYTSHGAGWPDSGQPVRLRADHVLLDEEGGLVALLAFESLGRARISCDLAVVCPFREAAGPDAREDQRYLMSVAGAIGARFVRPGAGAPAAIHRRRFAAPGRTLAASAPGLEGAGAFAMLAVRAEAIELAAALAGEPLVRPRPAVVGVRVTGAPRPGVGGAEIVAAIAQRLQGRARGAIVEFHGEGLASLAMAERIAVAALAPARLAAEGVVFPSDDVTRAYLRARGRDAEWRRAEGLAEDFDLAIELALESVEPPVMSPSRARLSALAEDEDVIAVALALEGGAPNVPLEVVFGGRAARSSLEREGVPALLEAAGATLLDPDSPAAHLTGEALMMVGGDPDGELPPDVTPCSAAALALALRGEAGAALAARQGPAAGATRALDPLEVLETSAEGEPAGSRLPRHVVPAVGAPLGDSIRGVVLLDAGDHARCDRILGWGPRLAAVRGDAPALAQHAFRARDEGFAARASAHGGGFLVAGTGYGAGEPCEHAARATAALGVKAVIAQSFAPRHARALALYGVLPLLWRGAPDDPPVRAGDELEFVDLAETLAPSRRLSVRHLTLGGRFDVTHDMDSRTLDVVRAGGLLGACARAGEPVAEGWQQ